MISKNLSSVKSSKRLTAIIISALVSLLYYPVGTIISLIYRLETVSTYGYSEADVVGAVMESAHNWLGIQRYGWLVATCMAVILAVDGFHYTNDPIAMDFYESLPVKKSRRFRAVYVQGLRIWVITHFLNLFLAVLICIPFRVFSRNLLLDILIVEVAEICLFLAVYSITILGMFLAGRFFVGVITTAFLFGAEFIVRFIFWIFTGTYFQRVYNVDDFYNTLYTSPFYYYVNTIANGPTYYFRYREFAITGDFLKTLAIGCLLNILIALIATGIALWVFGRRTREEAGKTIIFKPVQAVIKIFVSAVFGLIAGILLSVVFNMRGNGVSLAAGVFFMAIVTIITAWLMQGVIDSDVKSIFRKPGQTVAAVVLMILVFAIFRWDITGFDSYIPDADKIRSYALYPQYGGSDGVIYYNMYDVDTTELPMEKDDAYYRNNMYLTDTEAITELARLSLETDDNDIYEGAWEMVVCYRLKSGRTVQRLINIPFSVDNELMNRILGSAEYTSASYQFVDPTRIENGGIAAVEYIPAGNELQTVYGASIEGFNEAYKKDLENYNFDTVTNHTLLGQVNIDVRLPKEGGTKDASNMGEMTLHYSVYDCYENTIAYLENYGMEADQRFTADQVSSILVSKDLWGEDDEYSSKTETYDSKEDIQEILVNLITNDLDTQWSRYEYLIDYDYEIVIIGNPETDEEGNITGKSKEYYSYYFLTDSVPEFVEEDFD